MKSNQKKMLTVVGLLASIISAQALADIPMPPPSRAAEIKLKGKEATEFSKNLTGKWIRGSALRTGYSNYKVFRSSSGLTQIVCEIWKGTYDNASVPEDICTVQQSKNGQPLPEFHPVIRMG
jgi:hypothetical protein